MVSPVSQFIVNMHCHTHEHLISICKFTSEKRLGVDPATHWWISDLQAPFLLGSWASAFQQDRENNDKPCTISRCHVPMLVLVTIFGWPLTDTTGSSTSTWQDTQQVLRAWAQHPWNHLHHILKGQSWPGASDTGNNKTQEQGQGQRTEWKQESVQKPPLASSTLLNWTTTNKNRWCCDSTCTARRASSQTPYWEITFTRETRRASRQSRRWQK